MLDWIFEGIANWIASIMTQVMDAISGVFLEALGTDMTAMEEYFPFVSAAYSIIQYTAWALLFLIVVWQLFRTFGGPITEAEHPFELLVRGTLFAFLIAYAESIFSLVLDIARAPYTALMDSNLDPGDFTFAGIEQALTNGLTTIVAVTNIVGLILLIVMMIALGWNYFKLLLETVERYVLVGVLCYTSPLAYAMGASKSTSRVFQSWCRMVGSQLLLLVLNVWFLRAFNSSVGHFIANGGALTSGQGNIFLWIFCALALLKIAQRADSYLAAMGMSVAQTGSSMGMEMLMAARLITGLGHGAGHSAGSAFSSAARGAAAGGAAGAAGGFMAGFTSRYNPNSFVRDAVVEGGTRMGAGGSVGFVGRTFGGMAARNGATLNSASIASVATRPNHVSGTIAGSIADRSIGNFMPHLSSGLVPGGGTLSGTEVRGGHIQTTATMQDGSKANVDLYHAGQFNTPDAPYTSVTAADGSQWYQTASGDAMGAFYPTPAFTGDASEAGQIAESFPGLQDGTLLRQVDDGLLEASYPDGGSTLMYSSAYYQEPSAPHTMVQGADGQSWYAMSAPASIPQFADGAGNEAYNQALFGQFMPSFDQPIQSIDASRAGDGVLEVRHQDGAGTAFYDQAKYQTPRGDYQLVQDQHGGQWYAVSGTPAVEQRPVYHDGKAVYDGDKLRTQQVETVRYKTTPSPHKAPDRRGIEPKRRPSKK